jgi:invasion protein IalB
MDSLVDSKLTSLAVLLSLSLSAPAFAQAQRPAGNGQAQPAPGSVSQPDNTTASYGDWTYRCQQGVGTRVCEMVQTLVTNQGQRTPIALIAIGRPSRNEPYKLVIQVAPNVTLGNNAGVRAALGEKDEGTLAVFQRCLPGGCFGEVNLTEDLLKRWRAYGEAGQLHYLDGAGRPVALPFSLRGFSAAADALSREP